ncbi:MULTISPECIES: ribosome biogenesis GTPase YlqF [unclassified Granulicatella]|uniref:ribosome biogenesis GTPase YlqF n=1 Tax=unclassified Granulicatella TaxID=2630493 RepID=UPI0010731FA2|nr:MULTISPECIES: ribosome biogenesis GTPase YlqF [unclassified Granulicatella]MBF0781038.1 ribosome biogenesis GTPase YlqF [Granulicatella sp. 19428wC4_WM01]TFU92452.1 ribosome biogenesis GTPase YlqF [Granulicatella sp. WM01]
MTTIQWFPGHMAKARREAVEKLKLVDIIVELVDARLPYSSRNPIIDDIVGQKPRVMVLNKTDLADIKQTNEWTTYFKHRHLQVVPISAKDGKGIKDIQDTLKELMSEKMAKLKARGLKNRPIRLMILGIPNVGKSTLINRFIKKNKAETGNKPGVTKGQQWLKLGDEFELLDTPGILWPKFEDQDIGKKLALTGAIKDTILHQEDIALYAIDFFARYYPERLKKMYGLQDEHLNLSNSDLLIKITERLGLKEEYDKASDKLIHDVRQGKLGKYTLDFVHEVGEK